MDFEKLESQEAMTEQVQPVAELPQWIRDNLEDAARKAFNVEHFIARAVDSALAQDYKDVEVVVVNDCSTDKTTEILAAYGDKIQLITHEVNQGAGIARRNGIQASTGDFAITLKEGQSKVEITETAVISETI